jgi:phenylalanyl-tRNA synthetase beta chain
MKASLNWVRQYTDLTLPPQELARRITLAGIEVEAIRIIGAAWTNVVVGKLTAISPHPNADRLRLVTVDLGKEQTTVVTGAPNLTLGDKVAFARVGAELMDGHSGEKIRLKPAKIRGVVSEGMVCSEKELGLSQNYEGILILPPEAPLGIPLQEYLGDTVFDLEVTPNRPDCLSIIGLAREMSVITEQALRLPEATYPATGFAVSSQIKVSIKDADLCPRYCASLISGLKIDESPGWLKQRLVACGVRPINNVVDVTNYVMLEYGQPLHAFDYSKIGGKEIIVRRARSGEKLTSLDGGDRQLDPDMLVIADAALPVAIAGVMGGVNSEVTSGTTEVLIEAASFNPASVHYTSRRLNLLSEASTRFERGISAEMTLPALFRATQLMCQLGGGLAAEGIIDVYPGKKERVVISLALERVFQLLGVRFSLDLIVGTLTALGFTCHLENGGSGIAVVVPYWRTDIRHGEDIIEEIARTLGYDKIPMTMLGEPLPRQVAQPHIQLKQRISAALIGLGFQEVLNYALTGERQLNSLKPDESRLAENTLRLVNPMSADQEYLRPTLRASLLGNLVQNRRYESGSIRLFEIGRVYLHRDNDLPEERDTVCGLLAGPRQDTSWAVEGGLCDYFDAKGALESLFARLGVSPLFAESTDVTFTPAKQAAVMAGSARVGLVGEIHPRVARKFDLAENVYLFELDLTSLLPMTLTPRRFQSLPRYPAVVRDLALVLDEAVPQEMVYSLIRSVSLVSQVVLFDVYSGKQVPPGKKSLAYRLTYQSPGHTLTDGEVERVQHQILDKLARGTGATVRGE